MKQETRLTVLGVTLLILLASLENGDVNGWWWGKKAARRRPPPPRPKPVSYEVPGYTHRYGECDWYYDLKKITFATKLRCAQECNERRKCKAFKWVKKGPNGRDSYCWLKDGPCPNLTSTGNKDLHFYTKIGHRGH